jgi:multiple sugar transport system substrate-binding protein
MRHIRLRRAATIGSMALFLLASACSGGGSNPNGVVNIILWHGYEQPSEVGAPPNYEVIALNRLVAQFNRTHPKIHVQAIYCCTNDDALKKLTVALQGDKQPDIAYEYGSSMPQLATAPKIVDLTSHVQTQAYNWNDFFRGERAVTQVDGKVLGVPALVDNLAIVYNKKLFDQAGLSYPTEEWTWDDFRAAAKALTDSATKQFGMAYPADATEDTVWHYEAMLWEAGGDILTPDNTHAAFNSPAGLTALTMLQDLAVTDKSMFVDIQNSGKADTLFNSGKIGMVITGPWELASYPDADYGVQIMPAFPGGNHQTISGPDNWVMFDNGQARVDAAWTFLQWFTAPQQVLADSLADGHLPTRASVVSMPAFSSFATKYPDIDVFAENLSNVQKARPQIEAYPKISAALGQAIVAVLLGQSQPADALATAAQQTDQILAAPQ